MNIANPIYDVVFKYLMEDKKIAKLMLSSIIKEKIISLDFLSNEKSLHIKEQTLTVRVMDFSAKIETSDGKEKQVIIELQKAKFASDIIRFRRYLGGQYISKANIKINSDGDLKPLPIIAIYFLGYKLNSIDTPLIDVKRVPYDGITGEKILIYEEFIEQLSHDCFIVQVPYLKKKYRTDLEQLLSIFNQSNVSSDKHFLNINPNDYPEKHSIIIRRLMQAIAEEDVRDAMDMEDEMLGDLQNLERKVEKSHEIIKENKKTINENKKTLDEKNKALDEKNKALDEKDMAIKDKDKLINDLLKKLKKNN